MPNLHVLWLSAPSYRHRGFLWRLPSLADFRDLFTAIYIENPSLTLVEKLFHLNSKTSGEAHSIVSGSPLTNDGFRSAWNNLTERFENKRLQVSPDNTFQCTIYRTGVGSSLEGTSTLFSRLLNFFKIFRC